MKRYGSVIELKADHVESYCELHAAAWPGVLKTIGECNIRNYSIFLRQFDDGRYFLFGYFEYHGEDFAADMAKMAADPVTQRWWEFCKPCHRPFDNRGPGEWWVEMKEVFHCD